MGELKKKGTVISSTFQDIVWDKLKKICISFSLYSHTLTHTLTHSHTHTHSLTYTLTHNIQYTIYNIYIGNDLQLFDILQTCNKKGNETIFKRLFGRDVSTLSGRIRGFVGFTQACNTPFSGLAADGAKLAMWNLTKKGYRLIGFIHDEILLEIPETDMYDQVVSDVETIMIESMKELCPGVPIGVESILSSVWSKRAQVETGENGERLVWRPPVKIQRQKASGNRRSQGYMCTKCGQKKAGHSCPYKSEEATGNTKRKQKKDKGKEKVEINPLDQLEILTEDDSSSEDEFDDSFYD